jgi:hypothetical protein
MQAGCLHKNSVPYNDSNHMSDLFGCQPLLYIFRMRQVEEGTTKEESSMIPSNQA